MPNMSGEATETRLHFEGVLDKAGKRFFEGYRKRWFTLDGQELSYYKAAEKTEENYLGTIDFGQVKAVNPVKLVNNGFQILTKNRTYTFSAPTPELLTDWVSVLRQAMQLKSFDMRKNTLSSQSSIDSQYEEVTSRPNRSFSACSSGSNLSYDEDDSTDALYSSVGVPSGVSSVSQGGDAYSLVGASTLPKAKKDVNDGATYELVGSRPPSKSAPPTYEMVQAAKGSEPSKAINEIPRQKPTESTELRGSPAGEEDGSELYDVVRAPGDVGRPGTKVTDDKPSSKECEEEKQSSNPDATALYSLPKINRKQKPSSIRGPSSLSIISESQDPGDELASQSPVDEKPPPLPSPPGNESFAIEEIKRLLEEAKMEEGDNEAEYEKTNGQDCEEDVFTEKKRSAFEQLKEILQRLDSTEAE